MKKILLVIISIIFLQISVIGDEFTEIRYIDSSDNDAGVFNQLVSALSSQLTQNKNFGKVDSSAIAITSFVSVDDLNTTSRLSNLLSENLIHEMQIRGYQVIDFKTMDKIKINARGDFLFSRDLKALQNVVNVEFALTGTYAEYRSGTVVNARIINLKNHVVLSTAQILIPKKLAKRICKIENEILDFMPNKILLSE
jgi:TolB-like protein